uniref:LIM and SH3 domain protein 1 n=1 Tax=Sus scrofa TaxID=9823 RepID=A0A8D0XFE5_PIG
MNPNCARCGKIVYPTEKVNCLDKFWHKACFHCETCKMTLNMKNYKGYEKKPYCNAHYPKQSFTMVADTPENLRLKQQSELQSQVRYKEEFEKNKGKGFSVVADTPELQRIKKTQDQISNIKYHEEFEKSRMGPSGGEGLEPERRDAQDTSYRRPQEQQQPHHIPTSTPASLPAAPAAAGGPVLWWLQGACSPSFHTAQRPRRGRVTPAPLTSAGDKGLSLLSREEARSSGQSPGLGRATLTSYGSSQARGPRLRHSHSNAGSELCLTYTTDPSHGRSLTH